MCCFCGGLVPATSRDHQPARALFDRKEWPEGYEFPACKQCNFESKQHEGVLAVFVRLAIDGRDPQTNKDLGKYLDGMRNNYPDALRVLTTNEKRAFFKEEGGETARCHFR